MKSIDGIKIIQVDGLNRGGTAGDASTGSVSGGNLAEQALSAALSYRTQAPLIDSLLNEIGVSGGSLTALTSPLTSTTPVEEKQSKPSSRIIPAQKPGIFISAFR